jgi:hypothetical protein
MIRKLAIIKVFLQRSASYMTIINIGGLLFLVADTLKKYGFDYSIFYFAPLLFFLSILLSILLGYIDLKSGIYKQELQWGSENNPMLVKILEEIKQFKGELKK